MTSKQTTTVQTLILSKDKFKTLDQAKAWIKEHGFKVEHKGKAPDETETSYRFRQMDPGLFKPNTFRTITLTEGVKAVVGIVKSADGVAKANELLELITLFDNMN